MEIRLIQKNEITSLREMIINTYTKSFKNIYPDSWIESCVNNQSIERLTNKLNNTHFYGAFTEDRIVGCGAIGSYWGKVDESCLFSFCVDPNFQGQGIGTAILNAIKQDPYFTKAKIVYCPSSIPALPFYLKNGFKHVNNQLNYDDGSFLLQIKN